MSYFTPTPETLEALKSIYRKLATIHHPDCGGDTEVMKVINHQYKQLFAKLKDTHQNKDGETYTAKTPTDETPEHFIDIINELIHFEGVSIEIIGSFIWVSGNTKNYKEQLKTLGFKWSSGKSAWYLAPAGYKKRNGKQFEMDEIRTMFGSKPIETKPYTKLPQCNKR